MTESAEMHCAHSGWPMDALVVPTDRLPGVYALTLAGAVVYVGQSQTVQFRVATHIREQPKNGFSFDSSSYIPYPADELDFWETFWICRLKPHRNRVTVDLFCLLTSLGNIHLDHADEIADLLLRGGPTELSILRSSSRTTRLSRTFPQLGRRWARISIRRSEVA